MGKMYFSFVKEGGKNVEEEEGKSLDGIGS